MSLNDVKNVNDFLKDPKIFADDPDFQEIFERFAINDVLKRPKLDDKTKFIVIQATLIGLDALDMYELVLPVSLRMGVTPIEMKEILYQSTAYVGIGTTISFFKVLNDFLAEEKLELPIKSQKTVEDESKRAEAGNAKQVELFGPQMKDFLKTAPAERAHVNFYLVSHCFGDFYTRTGLDNKQREMVTFCYIAALGSCHPQLLSHTVTLKGIFRISTLSPNG